MGPLINSAIVEEAKGENMTERDFEEERWNESATQWLKEMKHVNMKISRNEFINMVPISQMSFVFDLTRDLAVYVLDGL